MTGAGDGNTSDRNGENPPAPDGETALPPDGESAVEPNERNRKQPQVESGTDHRQSLIRNESDEQPPAIGESNSDDDDDDDNWKLFARDVVTSILAVALIGVYLFAISGVWPPMVAVESGSMTPNMDVNDLVFVMETERFQPEHAHGGTGVVTAAMGEQRGYEQFGQPGDVIIFAPNGNDERTPIIHRAMLWVEEGENWCDRADEQYLSGTDQCAEAPNEGFITKGDSNPQYDQTGERRLSEPVKPEWVIGTAEVRLPGLGWLRLRT